MSRSILRSATVVAVATVLAAPTAAFARPMWDTSPVVRNHPVAPQPRIVNLRVGQHGSFDRVVIDLQGELPGYRVRYVKKLTRDGSGQRIPLKGKRFISVVLTPAKAHDASGDSTYRGPRFKQYQFETLRGVAFAGDFEAHVSFGLSLRRREDFRVFRLHHPQRIVIDLHH